MNSAARRPFNMECLRRSTQPRNIHFRVELSLGIWFVAVIFLGLLYPTSVVDCLLNLQSSPKCRDRQLTIDADNQFNLYVDGNEIVGLKNAQNSTLSDAVRINGETRLIAVKVEVFGILGGVIASLDRDDILTDNSWKCTNDFYPNWMTLSFSDQAWPYALVLCEHGFAHWGYIDGISYNANWITATESMVCRDGDVPSVAYCRKTLDYAAVCRPYCDNGSSGRTCIQSCTDLRDGYYQSCNGCHIYISCYKQVATVRDCGSKEWVWDDYAKRCVTTSATCQCPDEDELTNDVLNVTNLNVRP